MTMSPATTPTSWDYVISNTLMNEVWWWYHNEHHHCIICHKSRNAICEITSDIISDLISDIINIVMIWAQIYSRIQEAPYFLAWNIFCMTDGNTLANCVYIRYDFLLSCILESSYIHLESEYTLFIYVLVSFGQNCVHNTFNTFQIQ